MNDYIINEGTFPLIDGYADRTVNVFSAKDTSNKLNLNIARDELESGENIEAYLARQIKVMSKKLKKFEVLSHRTLTLTSKLPAVEIKSKQESIKGSLIYHHQLGLLLQDERSILVFSISDTRPITETQSKLLARAVNGFKPHTK